MTVRMRSICRVVLDSFMVSVVVNEVFYSIQGESTWAGQPCVFVRLTGCHLRCNYCDTPYAFYHGDRRSVDHIVDQVERFDCPLVELTGGEPLLQPNVYALMSRLCDLGKTVLVETSGACDISRCDPRVIRIVDVKTPGSGQVERNVWSNVENLHGHDELKFVICDRRDYEWSRRMIRQYQLDRRVRAVLMSAAGAVPQGDELAGTDGLVLRDLAQWILADRLPVKMQTQLHKLIWDPLTKGV